MTYTVVQTESAGCGHVVLGRGATRLEAQSAAVAALVASGKSRSMASSLVEKGLYGILTLNGEQVEVSLMDSVELDADRHGVIEMSVCVAGKDAGLAELARNLLAMLGLNPRITLREPACSASAGIRYGGMFGEMVLGQLAEQAQKAAMDADDAAK